MRRWSTLLLDDAQLGQMPGLPHGAIRAHADAVLREKPTPRALYERWEAQQWSADDLSFGRDRDDWTKLPDAARQPLTRLVHNFVIGEFTAIDRFGPLLVGAPDEESLLFLATQAADEARHMRAVSRMAHEVVGLSAELGELLPASWNSLTPAGRGLNALEADLVKVLAASPGDYENWLRAVALFHIVNEGVLALRAQRRMVATLRRLAMLPAVSSAFVAMTRDESRHIGFGVHTIRCGIADGYADAVWDVMELAAPLLVDIDLAAHPTPAERESAARTGLSIQRFLHQRLLQLDFKPAAIDALLARTTPARLRTAPGGRAVS